MADLQKKKNWILLNNLIYFLIKKENTASIHNNNLDDELFSDELFSDELFSDESLNVSN